MRIITLPGPMPHESRLIRMFVSYTDVIVHIRKPTMSIREMDEFLAGFTPEERKKLVLHSYPELSRTWGLERLHYPASLRPSSLQADGHTGYRISTSVHSWAEFNSLSSSYQDAFISPVFSSISKKGYRPNEDLRRTEKRENFSTNLIALGGIATHNIELLKQNVEDVALCGSVWLSDDPFAQFKTCYNLWHNQL
ncbi:thiamine phosphate synthase [Sphingobacterium paucimobilis]|nr:thiamine phosphate synthase [Sphingobacterium paucimobilis]